MRTRNAMFRVVAVRLGTCDFAPGASTSHDRNQEVVDIPGGVTDAQVAGALSRTNHHVLRDRPSISWDAISATPTSH